MHRRSSVVASGAVVTCHRGVASRSVTDQYLRDTSIHPAPRSLQNDGSPGIAFLDLLDDESVLTRGPIGGGNKNFSDFSVTLTANQRLPC